MPEIKKILRHLFLPHESNNQRAKLLHHKSLVIAIVLVLFATVLSTTVHKKFPAVLGVSTDIRVNDLLTLTNQERAKDTDAPLLFNQELANAAEAKGKDMLAKDYWAHKAPDGTTPWVFIKNSGYEYVYAGENLARGFTSAQDAVNAWMASPDHRRNMLSKNYRDVGFAVLSGRLSGEDTVLIVEELGSTPANIASVPRTSMEVSRSVASSNAPENVEPASVQKPLLSNSFLSKNIAVAILAFFIGIFVTDLVLIQRRKILRVVGHNEDHIFYFAALLVFILITLGKGAVL